MGMLTRQQIQAMGFAHVGKHTQLSDKASYYNCANMWIGDHVRIDDFCVLSAGAGGIAIGNHVHIAIYSSLIGQGRISLADFSGLSSRVSIYSSSDDYSGESMTNPTVPAHLTRPVSADVEIGRHAIVGAGSVVLPGVEIAEGAAIGALSLVTKNCLPFTVYFGAPARKVRLRSRRLLELEEMMNRDSSPSSEG